MNVQNESEYEDLLGLWSDLEAGLGVILTHPQSVQEFELRVWQYDRWMRELLERDTDRSACTCCSSWQRTPRSATARRTRWSARCCAI